MSEPLAVDLAPAAPAERSSRAMLFDLLAYWPALLTALLGLALCVGLAWVRESQSLVAEQARVDTELSAIRANLESVTQATFNPTIGLEAMIRLDGGISTERFEALGQRVVTLLPQMRSIVVAPDDIVRYVYPMAGNASVLNLDYRSVPVQYAQVRRARELGHPLLVGPVKLVQGGEGLIQRTPVFLSDPSLPDAQYWGVVSVVVDLHKFVEMAGLSNHPKFLLALYQLNPDNARGALIWGPEPLANEALAKTPSTQTVRMPGTSWVLAAVPAQGWGVTPLWRSSEFGLSLLITLALSWLMGLLVRQRRRLQRQNSRLSKEIDLGHRLLAELSLEKSRFRSLTELSSDWIWEQDTEFRFSYISRESENTINGMVPRMLGKTRWHSPELTPDVDWTAHRATLERRDSFRDFEYSHMTEAGELSFVSISGSAVFDLNGQFQGYRGTGRSITAAKLAEAALRDSELAQTLARQRLQALLDAAGEFSIIATDLQGQITLFSRGAEQMLGYVEAEVLGQSPARFHLDTELADRAAELSASLGHAVGGFDVFAEMARRKGSETRSWTYVKKDGAHLDASLTISMVRDQDGKPTGFLGIARDITEQRQAQRALLTLNAELESRVAHRTTELTQALATLSQAQGELLRSEKMAALGSLVAGIAHELNTPLGNCLTTASTLDELTQQIRRSFESGQMRKSAFETYLNDAQTASGIMLRSMATANELVTHFKQISVDQTSAQRRNFGLQSVLDDVLSLLRTQLRKAGIAVQGEVALARQLDSYPGPLGQVLSNLIINASLHAFEGKPVDAQISIHVGISDSPQSYFSLIVEDNGSGMTDEVRRRAFDPFFTTKMGAGGTGLGLNIVYNIVTGILGGQIELHSEPGKGSRFVMRLPFVAPLVAP
jgi:PAS domain S-box-containing protein